MSGGALKDGKSDVQAEFAHVLRQGIIRLAAAQHVLLHEYLATAVLQLFPVFAVFAWAAAHQAGAAVVDVLYYLDHALRHFGEVSTTVGVGVVKGELAEAVGEDGRPDEVNTRGDPLAESLAVHLSLSVEHCSCKFGDVLLRILFRCTGTCTDDLGEHGDTGHHHHHSCHSNEQKAKLSHW